MSGTIVAVRLAAALALVLAPSAPAATGILVVGDFGVGGERQRATGAAMRAFALRNPSQLLVTLGDNDYTRGVAFAANWDASFAWAAELGLDVAGALGNHDVEVGGGRYEFGRLRMPSAYYVRRTGDAEVIVLNSNAVGPAQTRWLRRTLARRTGFRRIAVFHHPPWTCGGHLGSRAVQRAWVPLLERGGVRLVLSGHDHNYQRFHRAGVAYVVHGGGGAGLYPLRHCPRGYPRRVAARRGYGFVHLSVDPGGISVRILDLAGRTIDRFRVT